MSVQDQSQKFERALGLLALGYLFFVVYGSLLPFEFKPMPFSTAWASFMAIPWLQLGVAQRADWVANLLLYIPLGFLFCACLVGRSRRGAVVLIGLVLAWLFGSVVAAGVEFTQLYFPQRTFSLNDLSVEIVGSLLGAIAWVLYGVRLQNLLQAIHCGGKNARYALLLGYALAYVALTLFPFDFLLSFDEWRATIAQKAGWIFAPSCSNRCWLSLLGEILIVSPLGALAFGARRSSLVAAGVTGLLLGVFIELLQLTIASGSSQGVSVLTRSMGFMLGAGVVRYARHVDWQWLRPWLRGTTLLSLIPYVVMVAWLNHWFVRDWLSLQAGMARLPGISFMPFYYHYFTTETDAMQSLLRQLGLYFPLGVAAWAWCWADNHGSDNRAWGLPMLGAALLASIIEGGKLFIPQHHPDPTNILIAAFSVWVVAKLLNRLMTNPAASMPAQENVPLPTADVEVGNPSWTAYAALVVGLGVACWGVASFPVQPALLALLFSGYGVLIWYRPTAMFIVIPAALALLDLAPWSGRFFFDEFDVLLLISVVIGYARLPPASKAVKRDGLFYWLTLLLGLAYVVGAIRGLLPWQISDANAWSNYYSPYNALRIAKAVVWSFLLYGLLGPVAATGTDVRRLFAIGMILGLAGTVAVLVWERFVFPGLFNFTDVYRVTGPFSQMHTGGADIETYLTLSMPFLVLLLFNHRSWVIKLLATLLLLGATYGVMVTFARIGFAAYGVALSVALLAVLAASRQPRTWALRGVAVFALMGLILAVALPIFNSPFTQSRLAQSQSDLAVRMAHWSSALQMRDPNWVTSLFGMGLGRFPETHYWRSSASRTAAYRLGSDAGNTFLRLGTGDPLYLEQFVSTQSQQDYVLSLRARSAQTNAQVSVSLCEKWLLTSARCTFRTIDISETGRWQSVQMLLPTGEVGGGPWYAARPVKLSIYNANTKAAIDVDQLRLLAPDGRELLQNGEFSQGMDRWFFSVDNDKPWHIWSLPVQVLFDQGWLGLVTLALFVALGLWRATCNAWRGDAMAGAVLASSVGFLVLGSLASLVDSPRLLLLFLLLVWMCVRSGGSAILMGAKSPH